MFIGHYAAAFVAARLRKDDGPGLGALFLAAQAVDVGFFLLVAAGVEHARPNPSLSGIMPIDLHHMPYTHGLPATFAWMLAGAALAAALAPKGAKRAWALLIGLTVGSHWLADLPVHRADLAMWDESWKVGFGLWDHPPVAIALELGVLAAALFLFAPHARLKGRLTILVGVLLVLQAINWFTPIGHGEALGPNFVILPLIAFLGLAFLASWADRPTGQVSSRARSA
jgi:hypothetical protein